MPYNIFDAFNQGLGSAQALKAALRSNRFATPEEEARLKGLNSQADFDAARAQFAPSYFSGQSNLVNNQAGLAGLRMKYLPEQMARAGQSAGLENQMRQLQLQALIQKMKEGPQYRPMSPY